MDGNEIYDAIIIGSGPAGCAAAKVIINSGYNVIIIDKETFPRKKTCAGVLPPRIFSELEIPDEICERKLFGYRLHSPSGKIVESTFLKHGFIVDRFKFDDYCVKSLKQNILNMNVRNINFHSDCVKVLSKNNSHRGKLLVGADGVNSVVRKSCGISLNSVATAAQVDVLLPQEIITKRIDNWFEVYYLIPFGYGWISPMRDRLKVGIGGVSQDFKKTIKESLIKFMEHPLIKWKIKDGKIENFEVHRIPMSGPIDQLVAERTLLAGDAGGFVYPGTGEGVYYAIKSGRLAGEVIINALEEQRFDKQFLEQLYYKKLEKNGLFSLRDVDFIEKVLSTSENTEKYLIKLQKFSNM